ncbi:MAG: pantoate--beta-alanine ligase [Actinomycetota bacterium]|nr:pantoate--beta-alanine ligase [Actinomycetota bacterium]
MPVEVIQEAPAWRERLDACRRGARHADEGAPRAGTSSHVALVPTMGSLHAGHMSLIRRAAGERGPGGTVAVTIYVNPLQFGAGEDLAAYPRDLEADLERAAEAGADVVFAPSVEKLWSDGPDARMTTVSVDTLTESMEGERRPGHFDGVTTIVAKLLSLSGPCWAYFGEKDFQQLAVVRRMVSDLSLPADIIACPTVRDRDGLALSSRNAYLTAAERAVAPNLYYALLAGKRAVEDDGVDDPDRVEALMAESIGRHRELALDYARVGRPEDLSRPGRIIEEVRLFMAARLGRARLIDNVAANPPARNH